MTSKPFVPLTDRRQFLAVCSALGLGPVAAEAAHGQEVGGAEGPLDDLDLKHAARVAGLEFDEDEREMMLGGVRENLESFASLREVELANSVLPALQFSPRLPGRDLPPPAKASRPSEVELERPADPTALAFLPLTHLAHLLRTRQLTSLELTELYLDRLEEYGPQLECVIELTRERALEQARRADSEMDADRYRGPLHGIPWGAKDLLAVRGYRTTWGAATHEDQTLELDATVVERLDAAGAVLVAKLTLGALAWGDVWFGGTTRNPWNIEQGSSGSSAGSAAATVAGLVGFAIGSETLGSIVSPSTRCGATGLRPTFGRVSRHGAMALSWSMDKLGPLCRSVEDCALVLEAIAGADGRDPTAVDTPFRWDAKVDPSELVVGFTQSAFEQEGRWKEPNIAVLRALEGLGVQLVPVELPDALPVGALRIILNVEAAAAFDELTRSGRDDLLVRQVRNAWPNAFREARTIPAVEYLQANRVRTLLMESWEDFLADLDALVVPSFAGNQLLATNLTGHPACVLPHHFGESGTPASITFVGKLFGENMLLALARAYQESTDWHRRHPPLFS